MTQLAHSPKSMQRIPPSSSVPLLHLGGGRLKESKQKRQWTIAGPPDQHFAAARLRTTCRELREQHAAKRRRLPSGDRGGGWGGGSEVRGAGGGREGSVCGGDTTFPI